VDMYLGLGKVLWGTQGENSPSHTERSSDVAESLYYTNEKRRF
jgi:hypothetical protein